MLCSANENLDLDLSFHRNSVWEHTRNALFLGFIHLCAAGSSIPEGYRILPCSVHSVHDFLSFPFPKVFKIRKKNLIEFFLTRLRLSNDWSAG